MLMYHYRKECVCDQQTGITLTRELFEHKRTRINSSHRRTSEKSVSAVRVNDGLVFGFPLNHKTQLGVFRDVALKARHGVWWDVFGFFSSRSVSITHRYVNGWGEDGWGYAVVLCDLSR